MPPDIKLYSDPELMTPHSGYLDILDAGSEKQHSIFVHNEGTAELLDMKVEVIPQKPLEILPDGTEVWPRLPDGTEILPLHAVLLNTPPSILKPGETWEAQINWRLNPDEKYGSRRGQLKVTGRHVR